jgi:hypothetical protein
MKTVKSAYVGRRVARDAEAAVLSVAAGALVAAATTLGLFLAFRYLFYQAIVSAGAGPYSLGGATGIFVPDQAASPVMDWLLFGYYQGGLLVALATGLFVGYWTVGRIKPHAVRALSRSWVVR